MPSAGSSGDPNYVSKTYTLLTTIILYGQNHDASTFMDFAYCINISLHLYRAYNIEGVYEMAGTAFRTCMFLS